MVELKLSSSTPKSARVVARAAISALSSSSPKSAHAIPSKVTETVTVTRLPVGPGVGTGEGGNTGRGVGAGEGEADGSNVGQDEGAADGM